MKQSFRDTIASYYTYSHLERVNSIDRFAQLPLQQKQNLGDRRNRFQTQTCQTPEQRIIHKHSREIRINLKPSIAEIKPKANSLLHGPVSDVRTMNCKFLPSVTDDFQKFNNISKYTSLDLEQLPTSDVLPQPVRKKSVRFDDKPVDLTKNYNSRSGHRRKSNSILKGNKSRKSSISQYSEPSINLNQCQYKRLVHEELSIKNKQIKSKYDQIILRLSQRNQSANLHIKGKVNTYSFAQYRSGGGQYLQPQMQQKIIQKYTDDLFPPVYSSAFRLLVNEKKLENIVWKRLPQVFKGRQLRLRSDDRSTIVICKQGNSRASDHIITCFNIIKESSIICRIFQNQQINQYGIYLLKIFQQNEWRYVIIDDFIPVRVQGDSFVPIFINIKQSQYQMHPLEVWPVLLEKAYASYYSTYENLHHGKVIDFLEELSSFPAQKIYFQMGRSQQNNLRIQTIKQTLNRRGLVLGKIKVDKRDLQYPIFGMKNLGDNGFYMEDPTNSFKRMKYFYSQVPQIFSQITIIRLDNFHFITASSVISANNIGRRIKNRRVKDQIYDSSSLSQNWAIRTFNVTTKGRVAICIRQKQNKIIKKEASSLLWVRVLLFLKQQPDSYRWIMGKYSNTRSLTLTESLEPGAYFLAICPEWKQGNYCNELTILIHSEQKISDILRTQGCEEIIQKGCSDLAQRSGVMRQIGKFICTYSIVHLEAGIIIENINNERRKGQIRIMRSIRGLKPLKCVLTPYNHEFYNKITNKPLEEIQMSIAKGESYSIILMCTGGLDQHFLKAFNFGA